MKKTTIADVAKHANVSKSTVSQYLNKRFDYMSEDTKQRIKATIAELKYQPNYVARSLKQKSTSTIGVIVANILHAFSTQIIRSIEDTCHENNIHIIVCNADDDPEKERNYIEMLMAKQVDGLIIFPTGDNIGLYEKMVDNKFPIVFVDRTVSNFNIPSVMLNNEKAVELAVDHFRERGYERIGIITTSIIRNVTPRVERISGFKKIMEKRGLSIQSSFIRALEISDIQAGIKEMINLKNPPQAIIAGNDLTLMEILKFIKLEKIPIPGRLAIIGIDDVSFASFYTPTLSTIAQPTADMGKKAATLLLKKIKEPDLQDDQHIYRFEPTLIIRESS